MISLESRDYGKAESLIKDAKRLSGFRDTVNAHRSLVQVDYGVRRITFPKFSKRNLGDNRKRKRIFKNV